MILYRIDCAECGAPRVGRRKDGKVVPLIDECPLCDSTRYVVPADERE